jgi:1-acyl-sn-glycerol-3-phosphate acyltransferase
MGGFHKMKLPIRFLIKKEWLRYFPLNKILLSAGALGIERDQQNTMVDRLVETIKNSDERMAILITPEGTRKRACIWKTGFYYIALNAQIPIFLSYLDYSKKLAVLGPSFMPSGNFKGDMQIIKDFYKDVVAKYPENFCLDIYQDEPESEQAWPEQTCTTRPA